MFFEPIGIAGVQPWAGVIGVTIFEKYVESGVSTSIYEVNTLYATGFLVGPLAWPYFY